MGSTQISLENLLQVKAGRWAIAGGGCWAGGGDVGMGDGVLKMGNNTMFYGTVSS